MAEGRDCRLVEATLSACGRYEQREISLARLQETMHALAASLEGDNDPVLRRDLPALASILDELMIGSPTIRQVAAVIDTFKRRVAHICAAGESGPTRLQ